MRNKNLGWALATIGALAMICAAPAARLASAQPSRGAQQNDQKPKTQRYALTGTVLSIDIPNHQIEVDGDAVPGYMDAMSMPYSVPDDDTLKILAVNDIIRADIVVQGNDAHLENIKVTGHAKPKT